MPSPQLKLFDSIKSMLSSKISLPDELAHILSISSDSAYRRIRGETSLTLEEAFIICKHFNYPLGALGEGASNLVTFDVNELSNERESFDNYIQTMLDDVNSLIKSNNPQIIYAAEDIPLYYFFKNRTLLYFKMFYWMKAIQNVSDLPSQSFKPNMFDPFYDKIGTRLYHLYHQVETTEIWTRETIQSTISEIKFFWDAGFITELDHFMQILDDLYAVLDLIKLQSETGEKMFKTHISSGKKFKLYVSELMIGTNSILAIDDNTRHCYLSYNTFNTIKTTNNYFANQTESWLNNLISKSSLISEVGEKQRHQFFRDLNLSVDKLKRYVMEQI
jgi:hypothetical protein